MNFITSIALFFFAILCIVNAETCNNSSNKIESTICDAAWTEYQNEMWLCNELAEGSLQAAASCCNSASTAYHGCLQGEPGFFDQEFFIFCFVSDTKRLGYMLKPEIASRIRTQTSLTFGSNQSRRWLVTMGPWWVLFIYKIVK